MASRQDVFVKKQVNKFKEIEYPTVYSNMMGIGMTPFDIAIVFGEVDHATTDEVLAIPRVKVLLAPEQAANLLQMLGAALTKFSENNGNLRQLGRITPSATEKTKQ